MFFQAKIGVRQMAPVNTMLEQHFRLIINAVLFARHDMTTGASNTKFLNPNYAMDDGLCL